jgi:hypothetical protein
MFAMTFLRFLLLSLAVFKSIAQSLDAWPDEKVEVIPGDGETIIYRGVLPAADFLPSIRSNLPITFLTWFTGSQLSNDTWPDRQIPVDTYIWPIDEDRQIPVDKVLIVVKSTTAPMPKT